MHIHDISYQEHPRQAQNISQCFLSRSGVAFRYGVPVPISYYPTGSSIKLTVRALGSIFFGGDVKPLSPSSTYVSALNPYSNGYYHWLTETLPAYCYYNDNIRSDCRFLIAGDTQLTDLQIETLEHAGIKNIEIIPHRSFKKFQNLTLLSHRTYGSFSKKEIENLRKKYTSKSHISNEFVYVSRADAATRKIANEECLITELKKLNFSNVTLSDMKFKDQKELFQRTKILVSIHGAGLSNILMMPPGSTVIEIFPHPNQNKSLRYASLGRHYKLSGLFYSLAKASGVNYLCIVSEPFSGFDNSEYTINIERLMNLIESCRGY